MTKIIILGIGSGYQRIKYDLDYSNTDIVAFTDNDREKWYLEFQGKKIIPPDEINKVKFDYIFIASSYYNEIIMQLKSLGISENSIIPYYKNDFDYLKFRNIIRYEAIINKKLENIKEIENMQLKCIENNLFLNGKLNIERINRINDISYMEDIEFKVFSQWGEDGIIQYLINKISIRNKIFVEFGVENYKESNTRFLLMNNNWSGLVIDGSKENIEYIKNDDIYWRYDLKAKSAFITKDNINSVIKTEGIQGDIGLLSIDIDGNDYWVWKNIDVINPSIVICEYNSIFGSERAVTIPYDADFYRNKAHYSNLYYGASLAAICNLADEKGYCFIGCNSAGNDAFFVRKDLCKNLKKVSAENAYIESKVRESRDKDGKLTYISGKNKLKLIEDMELYDFKNCNIAKIKDLYNL